MSIDRWHEGDRVRVIDVPRWAGRTGRVAGHIEGQAVRWVKVALDGLSGVHAFQDHELDAATPADVAHLPGPTNETSGMGYDG